MSYKLRPTKGFQRDLKALTKGFKGKDKDSFKDQVKEIGRGLTQDPYPQNSSPEPWPAKEAREDIEFRKLRFKVQKRQGASGKGRLMYLVSEEPKEVTLAYLYTHEQYATRPPDSSIRDRLGDQP